MRPRVSPRRLFAFTALALTLAGCAAGGGGTAGGARRGSSTRLVEADLSGVSTLDLYDAISRLRPTWLRPQSRGTLPMVVVDGTTQAGGVDALRTMRVTDVSEIQYMNASDATTRYGTGYTAGAIIITTRR